MTRAPSPAPLSDSQRQRAHSRRPKAPHTNLNLRASTPMVTKRSSTRRSTNSKADPASFLITRPPRSKSSNSSKYGGTTRTSSWPTRGGTRRLPPTYANGVKLAAAWKPKSSDARSISTKLQILNKPEALSELIGRPKIGIRMTTLR